jgi:hypothetical protein
MIFSNSSSNLGRASPFLVARDTPLPPIPDIDEDELESMEYDSSASESDLDRRLSDRLESLRMLEGGSGTKLEDVKEEDVDAEEQDLKRNKPLPQTPLFNPTIMETDMSPLPSINSSVFRRSMPAGPGTPPKYPSVFSSPPPAPAFPPPPLPMDGAKSQQTRYQVPSSPFGISASPSSISVTRRSPSPPSRSPYHRSASTPSSRVTHSFGATSPIPSNTSIIPNGNGNAPTMQRAHSSPGLQSSPIPTLSPSPLNVTRSTSPMRSSASPKRVRSPFRNSIAGEEMLHSYAGGASGGLMPSLEISSISEDAELEIFPRASRSVSTSGPISSATATFPAGPGGNGSTATYSSQSFPRVLRRRPASPLRSAVNSSNGLGSSPFGVSPSANRASSVPASPHPQSPLAANAAKRFNEAFVGDLTPTTSGSSSHSSLFRPSSSASHQSSLYASSNAGSTTYSFPSFISSSVPSTPTSARSRSPSISSLETIPDTPDAEAQAVEEDQSQREERTRLWEQLYGSGSAGSLKALGAAPQGTGFASRDKRKRWSVCGAEKRGDLNLETIWEV